MQIIERRFLRNIFNKAEAPLAVPAFQIAIKLFITGGGLSILPSKRSVQIEQSAFRQSPPRITQEPACCFPRADVHHVDAQDCRQVFHRPVGGSIQLDRRQQIIRAGFCPPCRNRCDCQRIAVARLPRQIRKLLREMDDMFARAAGNFQHGSLRWQMPLQDASDRIPITLGCRRGALCLRGRFEYIGFRVTHSAATASSASCQTSIGFLAASVSSNLRRGA